MSTIEALPVSVSTQVPVDTRASTQTQPHPAQVRFIARLLQQEEHLTISSIITSATDRVRLSELHEERLSTVAVRDSDLERRYRLAVSAFRLSQYLQLGWIDAEAVYRGGLFHEPDCGTVPDNSIHVITVDKLTGRIVGYVALYGQEPRDAGLLVSEPRREKFPCESTHSIRLFDLLDEAEPDTRIENIWEVKRLVQRASNASDRNLQMAATLHQFYGIFSALKSLGGEARWLIGDAQEHVAIKQLRMTVRDLTVVDGTHPSLPKDNIYWPAYTVRKDVKPFAARVPDGTEMDALLDDLGRALSHPELLEKLRILKRRTIKHVRRVVL